MKNLKIKAVGLGLTAFLGLYILHLVLLPVLLAPGEGGRPDSAGYGISQFLGIATCVAAGFVAARVAGQRGWVHGLVVGGVGTVITALAALVWAAATETKSPMVATLPFWIVVNGFLAAIGGLVATNMDEEKAATKKP